MRAFEYSLSEAWASLWRGRRSGILSVATIALALFVLGGFLVLTVNLERLVVEWSSAADMSVYLKDGVTDSERAEIERALAPSAVVEGHQFVSKAEALARFKQTFGELAATADALGDNPMPASYDVRLKTGSAAQAGVDGLGAALRTTPGVADVRYDRQWLGRLLTAISAVRAIGVGLGAVLVVAGAFTVATVVRLALVARREEVEIMELVGAPTAYIRGPFVMEGVLQGGIGAIAALVALAIAFFVLRGHYLTPLADAVNLTSVRFLPWELSVALVLGGMAVGCAGGLVAAGTR
jgi:cell division transport system permease protein